MRFSDKIVLASHSPRRMQLMQQAEIGFVVRARHVDESFPPDMPMEEVPAFIARNKALFVKPECDKNELIIAADTMVVLGDEIIGKPESKEEAYRILKKLSGNGHRVITGVCMMKGEEEYIFSEITEVYFRALSDEQIRHYLANYETYDKAGAYAIQEWIGLVGIERINGDYFNVMGLPIGKVIEALNRF